MKDFNDDKIWNSPEGYGPSRPWTPEEEHSFELALAQWSAGADIRFVQVENYSEADLVEHIYTPVGATNLLGEHKTFEQASKTDHTAWGIYLGSGRGWTPDGLQIGGFGFVTIIHKLGHAVGLAHPPDNAGRSGLFPGGLLDAHSDLGDNDLN